MSIGRAPTAAAARATPDACPTACPLVDCARGNCAVVVRVDCNASDACRLRALGVYEGARVDVVDSRNGLLLQVRGSRIALGAAVAAAIAVIPVS
ncbi:MAG TPA: FeoA domain-containing protein [Gemmatimonadaceae bacterium]|nr:FeoA domain-containing protein [Gemmatimonadaceae bacterium]